MVKKTAESVKDDRLAHTQIEQFRKDLLARRENARGDTADRILEAARTLFYKEGFSSVSTDRLAQEAKISKSSIYRYYGDMNGVLFAIFLMEGDRFAIPEDLEPENEAAFWKALFDYGANLLTLLNRPDILQLDRMLHEEARHHEGIVTIFYNSTFGRSHRELTRLITFGQQRGYVEQAEPADQLADHLICIWDGLGFTRARLGLQDKPHQDPKAWSQRCIEALFRPKSRSV